MTQAFSDCSETARLLAAATSGSTAEAVFLEFLAAHSVDSQFYAGRENFTPGRYVAMRWGAPVPVVVTELCDTCRAQNFRLDIEPVDAAAVERDRVQALIDPACLAGLSFAAYDAPHNQFVLHCRSTAEAAASRELLETARSAMALDEPVADVRDQKLRTLAGSSWITIHISDEPMIIEDW